MRSRRRSAGETTAPRTTGRIATTTDTSRVPSAPDPATVAAYARTAIMATSPHATEMAAEAWGDRISRPRTPNCSFRTGRSLRPRKHGPRRLSMTSVTVSPVLSFVLGSSDLEAGACQGLAAGARPFIGHDRDGAKEQPTQALVVLREHAKHLVLGDGLGLVPDADIVVRDERDADVTHLEFPDEHRLGHLGHVDDLPSL